LQLGAWGIGIWRQGYRPRIGSEQGKQILIGLLLMQKQEPFARIQFAHRRNADGTFDSICCRCFATVSRQSCPSNHAQVEREHVCVPIEVHSLDGHAYALPESRNLELKAKRVKSSPKPVFGTKMPLKRDARGLNHRDAYAGLMAG
jgi:hypothetical protein